MSARGTYSSCATIKREGLCDTQSAHAGHCSGRLHALVGSFELHEGDAQGVFRIFRSYSPDHLCA